VLRYILLRRAFRTLPHGKGGLLFCLGPFSISFLSGTSSGRSRPTGEVVVNTGNHQILALLLRRAIPSSLT